MCGTKRHGIGHKNGNMATDNAVMRRATKTDLTWVLQDGISGGLVWSEREE